MKIRIIKNYRRSGYVELGRDHMTIAEPKTLREGQKSFINTIYSILLVEIERVVSGDCRRWAGWDPEEICCDKIPGQPNLLSWCRHQFNAGKISRVQIKWILDGDGND